MWVLFFVVIVTVIPPSIYKNMKKEGMFPYGGLSLVLEKFHITVCFAMLWFFSSFRGPFSADYWSYVHRFYSLRTSSVSEILFPSSLYGEVEAGFGMLNAVIGAFTDNYIWLFMISSAVVLLPIFCKVYKLSKMRWLSVLLFIVFGSYFTSFNLMRQAMAASIAFLGIDFLRERKVFLFSFFVVLGSLFHITTLLILPASLLLIQKPSKMLILSYSALFLILNSVSNVAFRFFDVLVYGGGYSTYAGPSIQPRSLTNAVVPIVVGIFIIFGGKKHLDFSYLANRILFNGSILWVFFEIISLQMLFIRRMSLFFSPFVILIIPEILSGVKKPEIRVIAVLLIVFFLVLYVFNSMFDGLVYYTIWNS